MPSLANIYTLCFRLYILTIYFLKAILINHFRFGFILRGRHDQITSYDIANRDD